MELQPIGDHIILKPLEAEKTTASGIIIPDTVDKERPERAQVIAVGPGKMLDNGLRQSMEVLVGDVVVFKKYAPDEVELDGTKYLIINASEVMAIVK